MKVLKRGITKAEEKLVGKCQSCNSVFEAEQTECWFSEDHNQEVTHCPVCPQDSMRGYVVKMYLETSSEGQHVLVRAKII